MKIQNTSLLLVGALACTPVVAQPADIILTQGKIISADTQDKIYQAMAVRDGKIIALGKSKEMQAWKGSQTQLINLNGNVVIPGLIDSHMHAIRAALSYSTEVHWFGLNSIEAALDKLKQAAARAKPGEWLIVAGGWTEEQFKEGRRPS